MKYNILRPEYFKDFICIGDKCEDTCCYGWNISIDRKTYKKYMKCKNKDMKNRLNKFVCRNRKSNNDYDYASFKLVDDKCAFLNEKNLCDIYINLGENNMCHTCKTYPRVYHYVNDVIQEGLTLSCIEAARLVLKNKNTMEFELVKDNLPEMILRKEIKSCNSNKILEKYFYEIRDFSIELIQNRKFCIEERLVILGLFFKKLQLTKPDRVKTINLIEEYRFNINNGCYDNILNQINLDKTINAQFSLLFSVSNSIIPNRVIFKKRYRKNLSDMIEGLDLYIDNIEAAKENFIIVYNGLYKKFIYDKEYIYENYLVNYMFNDLFPYNQHDNIIESYIELIINFVMIKLNTIGLCAYYRKDMNIDMLIELIQNYSRSMLHEENLKVRIHEYLKNTNQNTINHMILMIGK